MRPLAPAQSVDSIWGLRRGPEAADRVPRGGYKIALLLVRVRQHPLLGLPPRGAARIGTSARSLLRA